MIDCLERSQAYRRVACACMVTFSFLEACHHQPAQSVKAETMCSRFSRHRLETGVRSTSGNGSMDASGCQHSNAIDIASAVHGCHYLASSLTFLHLVCWSQLQAVLCKSQGDAAALGSG